MTEVTQDRFYCLPNSVIMGFKHFTNYTHLEVRTLRWMYGVTRKNKIKNEYIRGAVGVAIISGKVTERRWKWFWPFTSGPLEHACRQIDMEKPERRRGIPNTRRIDTVDKYPKVVGLERKMADDKTRWQRTIDDRGDSRK